MPEEAVVRKYLLGESTEDEAAALEREYFASEKALDEVGATEWDLIDDYLASRLPRESRSCFEGHYLSTPAHRTRLATARALRAEAAAPRKASRVLYLFPLAAAAILILGVLAVVWGLRGPGDVALPVASVLTVELPLVAVRGEGETPTAHLGPGVDTLHLHLERGEAAPPYEVLLRTVEGKEVWRGSASEPEVSIPAAGLTPGDYVVELIGAADLAPQRYYARLQRP
jgi:hypothetical protein